MNEGVWAANVWGAGVWAFGVWYEEQGEFATGGATAATIKRRTSRLFRLA